MEFQDIISSSLRKDMKELQQFQETLKEIKKECNTNIQREVFVRVMDYLELQLATEEVQECNYKKCLTALQKQFEKFLTDTSDCENKERAFQEFLQRKNYVVSTQGFRDLIIRYLKGNAQRAKQSKKKCLIHFRLLYTLLEDFSKEDLTNACFSTRFHRAFSLLFGEDVAYFAPRLFFNMDKLEKHLNAEEFNEEIAMVVFKNILISLMDSIEKAIAERGLYKRVHYTGRALMTKTTKLRYKVLFNEMIAKILTKTDHKKLREENVLLKKSIEAYKERIVSETNENGLGYTDPCPLGQAIACHPKLYDAKVLGIHYVKPDVHDTVEILNDAEESQVKMKGKQSQFNYANINSLYDTFVPQMELSLKQEYFSNAAISSESESSKEMSDLPVLKIPNESRLLKMFDKLGDALSGLYTRINKTLLQDAEHIKEELIEKVQEILNIFESMESKVDRTSKKHEILQNKIDQLLEANIANDVKNLVMQSYVEIKNKEEIERISKDNFAKLEAQSITFEIALQHKTQENNSLKTLQKENENFMASLQIENAHLKQTHKDLFESVQSSRVETIQCDEVKIKFEFDKIETQNIELEHQVTHLKKIIAQKAKDFDDVKFELSNRTAKFEAYFEKLENMKVVLE
ncbi:hypothetical protein Tco_0622555 [Tanacetum coccineum]